MEKNWELFNRITAIQEQSLRLPNASQGKSYSCRLDFEQLGLQDVTALQFSGLEETGMRYDEAQRELSGTPVVSGDIPLLVRFRLAAQSATEPLTDKKIILIINPDPRSLWKELPVDELLPFPKENNSIASGTFLDKKIIAVSKRGRSHANTGLPRDDHFAFCNYPGEGWSIVALADGAGSAKYAREGAKQACDYIVSHYKEKLRQKAFNRFDELIFRFHAQADADIREQLDRLLHLELGNGALATHQVLEKFAADHDMALADLHTTFIFCLIRKYEFGYVLLSFSVGDCPMAIVGSGQQDIIRLNKLDVGDYGGGTRFITMPEIFDAGEIGYRFNLQVVADFSYLMLMTDGIYDPKFMTEANLEKTEKWQALLADLDGENPEGARVLFGDDHALAAAQLSQWMDFWSSGNHDDRTLAIIY